MYVGNIFGINRRNLLFSTLVMPFIMNEDSEKLILSQENNKIFFYGALNDESCFKLNFLLEDMIEKNDEVNLYLQTTGGSVLPTLPIVDLIKNSPVPINTYIKGYCASAGTLLSVVGKKRYMTNNSLVLIHSLRQEGMGGNFNNIKDQYENANTIMDIIKKIYLENTNLPESLLYYYLDHDLWLPSGICLKYGIVDKIIN